MKKVYARRRRFLAQTGAILRPMSGWWRCELPHAPLFAWGQTPHAALDGLRALLAEGHTTLP